MVNGFITVGVVDTLCLVFFLGAMYVRSAVHGVYSGEITVILTAPRCLHYSNQQQAVHQHTAETYPHHATATDEH